MPEPPASTPQGGWVYTRAPPPHTTIISLVKRLFVFHQENTFPFEHGISKNVWYVSIAPSSRGPSTCPLHPLMTHLSNFTLQSKVRWDIKPMLVYLYQSLGSIHTRA